MLEGRTQPVEAYLDTNALLDLIVPGRRADGAEVLARLRLAQTRREIAVMCSTVSFEELAASADSDWERFRTQTQALLGLVLTRVIDTIDSLIKRELRRAGRLSGNERLLAPDHLRSLWRCFESRAEMEMMAREIRDHSDLFAIEERERRASVDEKIAKALKPGATRESVIANWHSRLPQIVDEWAGDYLKHMVDDRHLSAAEVAGRVPRSVPTLWNFYAYRLARVAMTVGVERRRIIGSELGDTFHYASGAYADVLVSGDRDFIATCSSIPDAAVRPISLDVFDVRYLRSPRTTSAPEAGAGSLSKPRGTVS